MHANEFTLVDKHVTICISLTFLFILGEGNINTFVYMAATVYYIGYNNTYP